MSEPQDVIDIENLEFYTEMFRRDEWSTDVINWGVFEQTLLWAIIRRVDPSPDADIARC